MGCEWLVFADELVLKLVWFVRWFHVEYEDAAVGYDAKVGWMEALRGCGQGDREIFGSYLQVCLETEVMVDGTGDAGDSGNCL